LDLSAKAVENYPFEEIVGSLQWIATVARPDICVPAATLARHVSKTANSAMVTACKRDSSLFGVHSVPRRGTFTRARG